MSAGKGDQPRNCFSKKYKDNYKKINWSFNIKKCTKCNGNIKLPINVCPKCGYYEKK